MRRIWNDTSETIKLRDDISSPNEFLSFSICGEYIAHIHKLYGVRIPYRSCMQQSTECTVHAGTTVPWTFCSHFFAWHFQSEITSLWEMSFHFDKYPCLLWSAWGGYILLYTTTCAAGYTNCTVYMNTYSTQHEHMQSNAYRACYPAACGEGMYGAHGTEKLRETVHWVLDTIPRVRERKRERMRKINSGIFMSETVYSSLPHSNSLRSLFFKILKRFFGNLLFLQSTTQMFS